MKDLTTVTDHVSITVVRGTSTYLVIRPRIMIPHGFTSPYPMNVYDTQVQFQVSATSQDEAEELINKIVT